MFATLSRSWKYAVASYGMVWRHKQLMAFPILSGIAALLVLASFAVPLHATGLFTETAEGGSEAIEPWAWVVLFIFYLVNTFIIVFFNSALVVCVMRSLRDEPVSVGDGLREAARRWPSILGWSILSAIVGVVLRALESNQKVGHFVTMILGTAWTALSYFVVPVIVTEQCGPIQALKRSTSILKNTWGTALVGNFSLGLIQFLIFLPILLIAIGLIALGVFSDSTAVLLACIVIVAIMVLAFIAISTAAGTVYKAFLFTYATGQSLPATVQDLDLEHAFRPERE
ncbi:MAG: hypothetical protein EA401_05885 [Planctomycetota bacterium]|nr:MAG: hypothetical protein EA401_05885 [Planctomycetota bacterium]